MGISVVYSMIIVASVRSRSKMHNYEMKHNELLEVYANHATRKENMPEWAVHMAKEKDKLVLPTIPFLGKEYENQKIKILVYASAEVLSEYVCVTSRLSYS